MRLIAVLLCLFAGAATIAGDAAIGKAAVIEMKDSTRVVGVVAGLQDGVYTIVSDSVGTLKVDEDKIKSIQFTAPAAEPTAAPAADNGGAGMLGGLQQKILANPDVMMSMMELANDPAVLEILDDPEVMKLIEEGKYFQLMQNEKIKALMDNQSVRRVSNRVLGREPAPAEAAGDTPAADNVDADKQVAPAAGD
jgi:hypothetical protein